MGLVNVSFQNAIIAMKHNNNNDNVTMLLYVFAERERLWDDSSCICPFEGLFHDRGRNFGPIDLKFGG